MLTQRVQLSFEDSWEGLKGSAVHLWSDNVFKTSGHESGEPAEGSIKTLRGIRESERRQFVELD